MKIQLPFRFIVVLVAVGAVHVCIAGVLWRLSSGDNNNGKPPAVAGEEFEIAPPDSGDDRPLPPISDGGQVSPPPIQPRTKIHIVAPGESYWGIANRYKTTVAKLRTLNNQSANHTLQPGEKLKVP